MSPNTGWVVVSLSLKLQPPSDMTMLMAGLVSFSCVILSMTLSGTPSIMLMSNVLGAMYPKAMCKCVSEPTGRSLSDTAEQEDSYFQAS